MGQVIGSMTFADRTSNIKVRGWRKSLHVFEGTRMVMVPVAAVVAFVHHVNRIPYVLENLKLILIFLFLLEIKVFFDICGDV